MNEFRRFALCFVCVLAATQSVFAVGPGDTAPAWKGTELLTGESVTFPEALEGKPAVVIFWATWCPYCKAFMPFAKEIQSEFADQGVQIITINSKERGRGDPAAYIKSLDFPQIAIAEDEQIAADYAIKFIPGLLIVDGDGKVAYRRRSTNLPAGKTVSEQWADEVRAVLSRLTN